MTCGLGACVLLEYSLKRKLLYRDLLRKLEASRSRRKEGRARRRTRVRRAPRASDNNEMRRPSDRTGALGTALSLARTGIEGDAMAIRVGSAFRDPSSSLHMNSYQTQNRKTHRLSK